MMEAMLAVSDGKLKIRTGNENKRGGGGYTKKGMQGTRGGPRQRKQELQKREEAFAARVDCAEEGKRKCKKPE